MDFLKPNGSQSDERHEKTVQETPFLSADYIKPNRSNTHQGNYPDNDLFGSTVFHFMILPMLGSNLNNLLIHVEWAMK